MTAPAPARLALLAGVHDDRPPGVVFSLFPGARATRQFVNNKARTDRTLDPAVHQLVDEVERKARPAWNAGGTPVVSIKLRPAEVLAGAWDGQLRMLGAYLAQQPNMILILWHEPEDDHVTAAAARPFVLAVNHARALVKAQCPRACVAYCAMSYQWRKGAPATADPSIWRAVEADLYLCDVYSGKTFPGEAILPEHQGFVRWKAEVVDAVPGREWGVGERGILAGGTRARTWLRERDWLLTGGRNCRLYMVWNTAGTEGETRWPQLESTTGQAGDVAAVRELLAAIALPGGYVPLDPAGTVGEGVVCERTGLVVARGLLSRHEAFLRHLGY
jgi:hypothetical protein